MTRYDAIAGLLLLAGVAVFALALVFGLNTPIACRVLCGDRVSSYVASAPGIAATCVCGAKP